MGGPFDIGKFDQTILHKFKKIMSNGPTQMLVKFHILQGSQDVCPGKQTHVLGYMSSAKNDGIVHTSLCSWLE